MTDLRVSFTVSLRKSILEIWSRVTVSSEPTTFCTSLRRRSWTSGLVASRYKAHAWVKDVCKWKDVMLFAFAKREGERERVRVHGINYGHVATGKSSSMAKYNYGNCSK